MFQKGTEYTSSVVYVKIVDFFCEWQDIHRASATRPYEKKKCRHGNVGANGIRPVQSHGLHIKINFHASL
jgi:hypothetical protein